MRGTLPVLLVAVSLLAGCSRNADRAPPPQTSGAEPRSEPPATAPRPRSRPPQTAAAIPPGRAYTVVPVFYGTSRLPTGASEPNRFYGNQRNDLQLGLCEVSIPQDHETGEVERPKIWKFEFREDPEKHVVLLNVQPHDGAAFVNRLRRTVAAADEKEAFVFIHGYNVTFADAARRTAQIAHDLGFRGAPIFYSWPARGELAEYMTDENTALWAESHAAEFLEAIARASGARRIHLIAHSMGNRILAGGLHRLAQSPRRDDYPLFNQVVLTAPDLDAATFKRDIAPRILQTADRITIYASENDLALAASKLAHGAPRLGQGGRYLTVFPEFSTIDVIEASAVDTSLFGHSYYGSNASVLDDLRLVLRGKKAHERGLGGDSSGRFWTMLQKVRQATGAGHGARR